LTLTLDVGRLCTAINVVHRAFPVDRETEPELSAVVEPLAMDTTPLEPLVPALADAIAIAPLDVAVPEPLVRLIAPPVEVALVPAAT
jgi:hypothetical protein